MQQQFEYKHSSPDKDKDKTSPQPPALTLKQSLDREAGAPLKPMPNLNDLMGIVTPEMLNSQKHISSKHDCPLDDPIFIV